MKFTRVVPPNAKVYSLPRFAASLRRGAKRLAKGGPSSCGNCGSETESGIYVRHKSKIYCEACVPRDRTCPTCEKLRPLTDFDIYAERIQSPCTTCRREKMLKRYIDLKRTARPCTDHAWCPQCKRELATEKFYNDGRYSNGLLPICRLCRNTISRATQRRLYERGG